MGDQCSWAACPKSSPPLQQPWSNRALKRTSSLCSCWSLLLWLWPTPAFLPSRKARQKEQKSFAVVQWRSHIWRFVAPRTAAHQASRPSPSPGVCPDSCPLSRWCHPTFSSSSPSPPALNLAQQQGLFQRVGSSHQVAKSIGALASASVLPMNIQGWFPLGRTGLILQSKGLKSLLQHHSSKVSILQCSAFFTLQCSHPYMTTGKTIADLCSWPFVSKVTSLFFNMLFRFVKIPLYRSDYKLSEAHRNLAQDWNRTENTRVLQVWDKEFWSYLNLGLNPGSTIYQLY